MFAVGIVTRTGIGVDLGFVESEAQIGREGFGGRVEVDMDADLTRRISSGFSVAGRAGSEGTEGGVLMAEEGTDAWTAF